MSLRELMPPPVKPERETGFQAIAKDRKGAS